MGELCLGRTRLSEKGKMSDEDNIYPVFPNVGAHHNRLGNSKNAWCLGHTQTSPIRRSGVGGQVSGEFKDPQVIPTCSQVWNHFPVCYLHVSETLRKDLQCDRIQIEKEIGSEEERTMRKEDDEAKG